MYGIFVCTGSARAAELLLTARKIAANKAYTMGIVNKVNDNDLALEYLLWQAIKNNIFQKNPYLSLFSLTIQ